MFAGVVVDYKVHCSYEEFASFVSCVNLMFSSSAITVFFAFSHMLMVLAVLLGKFSFLMCVFVILFF